MQFLTETYLQGNRQRLSIPSLVYQAVSAAAGEIGASSGVELNLDDFTRIRFGQDKRLDEVARMLQSSDTPTVRMIERPELRYASERNAFKLTRKVNPRFLAANTTRPRNNRTMSSGSQRGRFLYPWDVPCSRSVPYPQSLAKRMPSLRSSFRSIFSLRTSP